MRGLCLHYCYWIILILSGATAHAQTKLLRFPDICNEQIVFTYGGDLWAVSAQGGTAVRLTAAPGLERSARFSPDCSQIAFTGQYQGDDQVYIIPASGGIPKQLTFYPAFGPLPQRWGFDNQVYDWTPDGQQILFRSYMEGFALAQPRLFTISQQGGLPQTLPMPTSGSGRYSPDGKQLVYSPLFRDFRTWNRYQGGWAQDLYILNLDSGQARNITQHPRTDRDPMWIGNAVYFVSDRDDVLNLYRFDVVVNQLTQLTHHRDFDVRWASSDRTGHIVYEYGGELHMFDVNLNHDHALSIDVPTDGVPTRPEHISVAKHIEEFLLSPQSERALFVARGDIFSVPTKNGITRNLTHTSNAHEREVTWSADGKQIAYISDVTGEEALWVKNADGTGLAQQITQKFLGRLYAPRWAPNEKRIAFSNYEGKIFVVEVKPIKIGKIKKETCKSDECEEIMEVADDSFHLERDYVWSPKGSYLAYTLTDDNRLPSIFIWSVDTQKSTRVTDPLFTEFNPAFSPDGKFLYFIGAREWAPQISNSEWNYASNRTNGIYALSLQKNAGNPFPLQNNEAGDITQKDENENKNKGKKDEKQKKLAEHIDFEGLSRRLTRAPIEADNINNFTITEDYLVYTVTDANFYGRDGRFKPQLHTFSLEKCKDNVLAKDIENVSISNDGKKLLVQTESKYKLVELDGKIEDAQEVNLTGLEMERIPAEEFSEIFNEVWRRYRDYFYVSNMHGYGWNKLRAKYLPLVKYVGDRSDLNYLLGQMIAELNVSHAYVNEGDLKLPEKPYIGLLGAHFEVDTKSGRYRIKNIMQGQNDEERYRSPLTEVGIDIKVGDYILAINGKNLTATDNPYELLHIAKDQLVELLVNDKPYDEGARTVLVKPIENERSLHYLAWVSANRDYVNQHSEGKLGYLHIPDMGANGIREFIKWYYPQLQKQGLIVDVRDNGGGNVSAMIIERLRRKLLGTNFDRVGEGANTYPQEVFIGPLVALTSESTASDGDIFSYMFRQAGLGKLIGKRTWGGVVGINNFGPLLDGGEVRVPSFATADTQGHFIIEGEGVTPDIEVENDAFPTINGKDPQLDRAIFELMDKIKTFKPLPTHPIDPIKAPLDMRKN